MLLLAAERKRWRGRRGEGRRVSADVGDFRPSLLLPPPPPVLGCGMKENQPFSSPPLVVLGEEGRGPAGLSPFKRCRGSCSNAARGGLKGGGMKGPAAICSGGASRANRARLLRDPALALIRCPCRPACGPFSRSGGSSLRIGRVCLAGSPWRLFLLPHRPPGALPSAPHLRPELPTLRRPRLWQGGRRGEAWPAACRSQGSGLKPRWLLSFDPSPTLQKTSEGGISLVRLEEWGL